MIREFGLSAPGLPKNEKSEFAFQTRSLTNLYQRVLSGRPKVENAWKVLVEVLPEVVRPKPRNLLGVLAIQVPGRPNDLLDASDDAKPEMALNWLMCGIDWLTKGTGLDAAKFHSAAEVVRQLKYVNSYVWRKPVASPMGDKIGELIIEHGIHEVKIFGRSLSTDGQLICQQLLTTARPDELCFVPLLGRFIWVDNSVMELTSKAFDKKWRFSAAPHAE